MLDKDMTQCAMKCPVWLRDLLPSVQCLLAVERVNAGGHHAAAFCFFVFGF